MTALLWATGSDEQQAALSCDPAVAAPGTGGRDRSVFTGKDPARAIAYATPLSYPFVAERLPALLVRALR